MQKKPRNRKPPQKHSVNQLDFDESEEEILSVSCREEEINAVNNHSNKILATMKIGEKEVKNVNWLRFILQLPADQVPSQRNCGWEIESHPQDVLKVKHAAIGKAEISLVNPKNVESYLIDFTIVDGNFAPLLGLETAQQMKLVVVQTLNILFIREETLSCDAEKPEFTKDAVMSEYSDIFGEELGRMEGKVHLESDPNVAPTVMLLRHVPVALREKLKNELDRSTQRKVISPIQECTEWI